MCVLAEHVVGGVLIDANRLEGSLWSSATRSTSSVSGWDIIRGRSQFCNEPLCVCVSVVVAQA